MARTAKRKRKRIAAARKRHPTKVPRLLKLDFGFGPGRLFSPEERRLRRIEQLLLELRGTAEWPPATKSNGTKWVPEAYARQPDELLAMGITGASRILSRQSRTAPDCAKPLGERYIEKLLRELGVFPKARRGSPKQRPK